MTEQGERKILEKLGRIEQVLIQIRNELVSQNDGPDKCPFCGSDAVDNTSVMGEPTRWTCGECGRSFELEVAS